MSNNEDFASDIWESAKEEAEAEDDTERKVREAIEETMGGPEETTDAIRERMDELKDHIDERALKLLKDIAGENGEKAPDDPDSGPIDWAIKELLDHPEVEEDIIRGMAPLVTSAKIFDTFADDESVKKIVGMEGMTGRSITHLIKVWAVLDVGLGIILKAQGKESS